MEHDKYAVYIILIVAIVGIVSLVAVIGGMGSGDLTGQAFARYELAYGASPTTEDSDIDDDGIPNDEDDYPFNPYLSKYRA